jgi:hypothetical protein
MTFTEKMTWQCHNIPDILSRGTPGRQLRKIGKNGGEVWGGQGPNWAVEPYDDDQHHHLVFPTKRPSTNVSFIQTSENSMKLMLSPSQPS